VYLPIFLAAALENHVSIQLPQYFTDAMPDARRTLTHELRASLLGVGRAGRDAENAGRGLLQTLNLSKVSTEFYATAALILPMVHASGHRDQIPDDLTSLLHRCMWARFRDILTLSVKTVSTDAHRKLPTLERRLMSSVAAASQQYSDYLSTRGTSFRGVHKRKHRTPHFNAGASQTEV
ncbi:hypothetical protein KIPB_016656, partial [Kipferlia bialata]